MFEALIQVCNWILLFLGVAMVFDMVRFELNWRKERKKFEREREELYGMWKEETTYSVQEGPNVQ